MKNLTHELSVPALAYRLGCTIPQAQGLIRSGRIPGYKTTAGWVTSEAALSAYLAARSGRAALRSDRNPYRSDGP